VFLILGQSVLDLDFPARDIFSALTLRSRLGWQSADEGQRILVILVTGIAFTARVQKTTKKRGDYSV